MGEKIVGAPQSPISAMSGSSIKVVSGKVFVTGYDCGSVDPKNNEVKAAANAKKALDGICSGGKLTPIPPKPGKTPPAVCSVLVYQVSCPPSQKTERPTVEAQTPQASLPKTDAQPPAAKAKPVQSGGDIWSEVSTMENAAR